jgi:hypothetical protein
MEPIVFRPFFTASNEIACLGSGDRKHRQPWENHNAAAPAGQPAHENYPVPILLI